MSAATERQSLPLVTCTPWCSKGDGHPDELSSKDQWCGLEIADIGMCSDRGGDADSVTVHLQRVPGRPVEIVFLHEGPQDETRLMPDEARKIAVALIAAADVAKQTNSGAR